MIQQRDLDPLWGGVITSWSSALADFRLSIRVEVAGGGSKMVYDVTFTGVSTLRFDNPRTTAWDYVELTAIELRPTGENQAQALALEFWNGIATATIRCATLDVRTASR